MSVVGILERTKILRAKEERISVLETENAILHLQIAQLQSSFKKLLSNSIKRRCDECKKCEAHKENTLKLQNQIKLLQDSLSALRNQYALFKEEFIAKLHLLSTTLPLISSVIQERTKTATEASEIHAKYLVEKQRRKELHNTLVEIRGNIRVHCRVRPVLDFDHDCSNECVQCIDDEKLQVQSTKQSSISGPRISRKLFEFERVHGPLDSQQDVFEELKPLITSLLDGYNVCIMAYGQTGSGKSYTMLGDEIVIGSEEPGITQLAAHELFRLMDMKGLDYDVAVTVVEVYNEQIRDLLFHGKEPDTRRHSVVSCSASGNMEVTNLTSKPVASSSDLIAAIEQGVRRRAADNTQIHNHSSRSHLIVTIHVSSASSDAVSLASSSSSIGLNATITPVCSREATPMVSPIGSPPNKNTITHSSSQPHISCSAPNIVPCSSATTSLRGSQSLPNSPRGFYAKLQLVDLAGSECVGASGASGDSLKEAQYINRSLSSLSDTLSALAEKRKHIPYRNSILTHLLQDTIGGDAKMVMMLCVSPTSQYLAESLRVLGFGSRARQVQRTNLHKKSRRRNSQNH